VRRLDCVGRWCTVTVVSAERPEVANLAATWASTDRLVAGLDVRSWELPTDCPGWTVKDQVSHLVGVESLLLGVPAPDPVEGPHVRNPLGAANEGWIAERRGRPPQQVLEEFRQVTRRRLERLRAMPDDQWAAPTDSPVGRVPYGEFMRIRVMDSWVHEQDIRRAVGRPGHLDGPVAGAALALFTGRLGYVVGKRVGAPEGTTVAVGLVGPQADVLALRVTDGRARPVDAPPRPDVRLTMTAETYCCLSCGRWAAGDVLADGRVRVDGDADLAGRVVSAMSIIP
jgi:uncharacterized protein (TIGR03083 family)